MNIDEWQQAHPSGKNQPGMNPPDDSYLGLKKQDTPPKWHQDRGREGEGRLGEVRGGGVLLKRTACPPSSGGLSGWNFSSSASETSANAKTLPGLDWASNAELKSHRFHDATIPQASSLP